MSKAKVGLVADYLRLYEQYKKQYEKIALLYQKGAFYEIYSTLEIGNAEQVCKDLGIRLTQGNKNIETISVNNPRQGGFRIEKLDFRLRQLLEKDYTVIIYNEQDNERGTKDRKLSRIVTRSTFIDDTIDEDFHNIVCLYIEDPKDIGISIVDLTTGISECHNILGERVPQRAAKIIHSALPKEILCYIHPKQNAKFIEESLLKEMDIFVPVRIVHKNILTHSYQDEFLAKIYCEIPSTRISPVEYLHMEYSPSSVISFVLLIKSIYEFDVSIIQRLSKPKITEDNDLLYLSHRTINELNIIDSSKKSLYTIINKCSTAMGSRLLKQRLLSPITSVEKLNRLYNNTSLLLKNKRYIHIEEILSEICDLERYHRRIVTKKFHPFDLNILYSSYLSIQRLLNGGICKDIFPKLQTISNISKFISICKKYIDMDEVSKYGIDDIHSSIFNEGIYSDIDTISHKLKSSQGRLYELRDKFSKIIDDSVQINFTRTDGYFLIIKKRKVDILKNKIGKDFLFKTQSSNVRIIGPIISDISSSIIRCKDRLARLSKQRFLSFIEILTMKFSRTFELAIKYIANLDVINSSARVADMYRYVRPEIVSSQSEKSISFIDVTDLRHPIVESSSKENFISNSISIGNELKGMILYGVNGSGKSVLLKSVGIAILLAQAGIFVPAKRFRYYPYENLITKIITEDNIYKGQSKFVCESIEMDNMIHKAGPNTLILGDELCCGTETNSAVGLVGSSIERLLQKDTSFILSTHLHQLSEIIFNERVQSFHFTVEISKDNTKKDVYDRNLKRGKGPSSYGIEIAKKLNVGDADFIRRAFEIRDSLNSTKEIVSTKRSRYNKNIYMTECEECGSKSDLETHHIMPQKDADENGMLPTGIHKNSICNLKVLCKKCHASITYST